MGGFLWIRESKRNISDNFSLRNRAVKTLDVAFAVEALGAAFAVKALDVIFSAKMTDVTFSVVYIRRSISSQKS